MANLAIEAHGIESVYAIILFGNFCVKWMICGQSKSALLWIGAEGSETKVATIHCSQAIDYLFPSGRDGTRRVKTTKPFSLHHNTPVKKIGRRPPPPDPFRLAKRTYPTTNSQYKLPQLLK